MTSRFIEVEKISDELLNEVVKGILKAVDPVKIFLFGSYAYGDPHRDSDLDILVVVDKTKETKRELRTAIRRELCRFLIPKDIVVTAKDVEEWKNVPQAFITSILRKGKVLYERQD